MSNVTLLHKETYLSMIRNAAGTKMFRNLWANDSEAGLVDLTENGSKSCAVFVSSVLYLFGLISSKRATVESLERNLVASGWTDTSMSPGVGDVIVWEPIHQNGHVNAHVGFCLNTKQAVSSNWKTGHIGIHHITYGTKKNGYPVRLIEAVYTHDFLS